jgi:hypothetical protein
MPKYRITGPDGAVYNVDAPNEEALQAAVQQMFSRPGAASPAGPSTAGTNSYQDEIAAAGAAAQPKPTTGQVVANDTAYSLQQFRRGLGNLAGLPVDAINNAPRALNLLNYLPGVSGVNFGRVTGDTPPIGGGDFMNAILDAPGRAAAAVTGREFRDVKPMTLPGAIAGRVSEELGGAVVPAGAVLRAAKTAGPTLSATQKFFGVDKARVAPQQYVRDEATIAAGAGAGAGVAQQATRAAGYQEGGAVENAGEIVGGLSGGLGTSVGKSILGAGGTFLSAVTGATGLADNVVRNNVTDTLLNSSSRLNTEFGGNAEAMAGSLQNGQRLGDIIPGFRESTADRLRDPGLAALEYNRQSQSPGAFTARRAENATAVDNAMTANAPTEPASTLSDALAAERSRRGGEVSSRVASAEADADTARLALAVNTTPEQRGQMIRSAVDEAAAAFVAGDVARAEQALRAADDALAALAPNLSPQTRGEMLRAEITSAETAARTQRQEAYAAANVDRNQVPPAGLTERIDNFTAGLTETERSLLPQGLVDRVANLGRPRQEGPVPTGLLDETGAPITRPAPPPPPMDLKEATDLLAQLGHLERAARADPRAAQGGANVARVIGQLSDEVMAFVRGVLSPEEVARLEAARGASLAERETFSRQGDAMARALAEYNGGRPQVPSENVPGLFVRPGADEQLNRLLAAADTPATRAALEDHVLSMLQRDGAGDPERIRAFLDAYAAPLQQFPGLRGRIENAAGLREAAGAAAEGVAARQREFVDGSRGLEDVTRRTPAGAPSVPDASVPGRFTGAEGELDALLRRADTPDVRAALRDDLVSRLGALDNPQQVQAALDQLGARLDRFPGLRQQVEDVVRTGSTARLARQNEADFLREMGGTMPETGRQVQGQGTVAKWLTYGDENAGKAMSYVMGRPDPSAAMDDLLRFVGDDAKAVEAAKKAFWEVMEGKAKTQRAADGAQAWSPERLSKFFDDPATAAVAERLYRDNPEHLERIKEIATTLKGVDLRNSARAPASSGTAQAGIPIETIQSSAFAAQRGVVGPGYAVARIVGVWARRLISSQEKEAFGRVLDKALLDPDFAAILLKENNPANRAALARGAKTWMGNRASDLIDVLEAESDPDREMKRAIKEK